MSAEVRLSWASEDIQPLLPEIIRAADEERSAFGFLPNAAYEEFALQRRLLVALSDDRRLLGYLAYGGTYPQARIFQTYVSPGARGTGIGQALVEELVRRTEELSFLSIRAEVAEDLREANRFYANLGFRTVGTRSGGATTRRTILVRVRELRTVSLLDHAAYGESDRPPIEISLPIRTAPPLYLVDLNVLFDITRKRGRAMAAGRVFAAALDNQIALGISDEFIGELERHTKAGESDPVLELARGLPRLKRPSSLKIAQLTDEIGPLVFPARFAASRLTIQDQSDIAHLATAAEHDAAGFVTSEKAILAASQLLKGRLGIEVISPEVLGKHYAAGARRAEAIRAAVSERSILTSAATPSDEAEAKTLLRQQEVPDHVVRQALAQGSSTSPRRRIAVGDSKLIAFGSWDAPKPAQIARKIYLFVRQAEPAAELAATRVLNLAIQDSQIDCPSVIHFSPCPDQPLLRSLAIQLGFRPSAGSSPRVGRLEKPTLNSVITSTTWSAARSALAERLGVELPLTPPAFENASEEVRIVHAGSRHAVTTIGALEDALSPAIFALDGRPAVLVPIKPDYAEALFRGSQQPSFLEGAAAALHNERRYFSDAKTHAAIPDEGIIVFYESGGRHGRSAATALARIRRRYLADEEDAKALSRERGVLPERGIERVARGRRICVTEFDNVHIFDHAITLQQLKRLDCADNSNVVTARRLKADALRALISRAFHG